MRLPEAVGGHDLSAALSGWAMGVVVLRAETEELVGNEARPSGALPADAMPDIHGWLHPGCEQALVIAESTKVHSPESPQSRAAVSRTTAAPPVSVSTGHATERQAGPLRHAVLPSAFQSCQCGSWFVVREWMWIGGSGNEKSSVTRQSFIRFPTLQTVAQLANGSVT